MKTSSYDTYLIITKNKSENLDIIRLQTDNILNIRIEAFMKKKEKEIIKAKFKAKNRTIFKTSVSRDFNGYHITIRAESIIIIRKNSVEKLVFVYVKGNIKKQ